MLTLVLSVIEPGVGLYTCLGVSIILAGADEYLTGRVRDLIDDAIERLRRE